MPSPEAKRVEDPERYHRLAKAHPSAEAAATAVHNFWTELATLREKYGIPDVLAVCSVNYRGAGGVVLSGMHVVSYGDSALRPMMALAIYREESPMIQKLIESLSQP